MAKLQDKLLNMLDAFHKLCKENDLKYFVVGGTALGTARHGGFIPWDDDIDVGMPRPDYEKLKELVSGKDLDTYLIEFPSNKKDFVYPYGKMYDTTTTLVENTRYKTKRGIFIDIFPLDGIGNDKAESVKNFRKIDKKVNLLSTRICALRKGRKLYKNLAIILSRCVPNFILGQKKLMRDIDKKSKQISYYDSKYVANLVGNWHEKEIVEKEFFGEPIEYDFANIKVYGPNKIDEYLTCLYGDWRTPPPVEKQVSHHDYLEINLDKSYLE